MTRPIVLITGVLMTVTTPATSPASSSRRAPPAAAPSSRGPGPEHARLIALCGTWDVELTFWFQPGSPAVVSKGVSAIRPILDSLFIEEKIEGALNGAPFTTLAWTGFNPARINTKPLGSRARTPSVLPNPGHGMTSRAISS